MEEKKDNFKETKKKFSFEYIETLLKKLEKSNALIIGDTIIDEYAFVSIKARAIKDPILSTEFKYNEIYAGGVLAIANHISSFVKKIQLVTLLGEQNSQIEFIQRSLANTIELKYFNKKSAPTTIKKRYLDTYRNNKLFKVEQINDQPIDEQLTQEIILFLEEEIPKYDLIVVSDFGHGFINNEIRRVLEKNSKFLALNVQSNSSNMGYNYYTQYKKADFLTANEEEARLSLSKRFKDIKEIIAEVSQRCGFNNILITKGKKGCVYFCNNFFFESPAITTTVKDTVGAGDALFSIASLIAYLKAEPELLTFLANCAGAIGANTMGNKESVTKEKLLNFVNDIYKTEIKQYLQSVNETISNINLENIERLVNLLMETYQKERTIYAFGNGGSAATASHFCGDLIKGVSYGLNKRFRAVCLNENLPALMAIANDSSYDDIFVEQLKNFLQEGDLVIGISGSGNSLNIIKALEYANKTGAKTVAICGFKGGKSKDIADLSIHAEISDMEISEDVHHLILTHCIKRILTNELNNTNLGKEYVKRVS